MKKNILVSILATSIVISLVGCGNNEVTSQASISSQEATTDTSADNSIEKSTADINDIESESSANKEPELNVLELDAMIKDEFSKNSEERNHDQIKEWCNQAIDMGSGYAMYVLSCEYLLDEAYEKTLVFAQNAIDNNEPLGYNVLAYCYQYGKGVDVDINKVFEYANKEIEGGVAYGYAILGDLYYGKYEEIERDEEKMFENYKAYCELATENISYSYYCGLAECYFSGTGTPKNIDKGIEWFDKASANDNPQAAVVLAHLYYVGTLSSFDGIEVEKDYNKAISYFEKADELGHIDSSWVLGYTYLFGQDMHTGEAICDIDCDKALSYFEKMINSDEDLSAYTNQNLYLYAGKAAFKAGDYEKARLYSQTSIDIGEPGADTAQSNIDYLDEHGL